MTLEEFYDKHERVALLFSGGKDSVAMMHLTKPYWDKTVFMYVNTCAAFPEVTAYIEKVRKEVPHFVELVSNQPEFIANNGFPSDVVPVANTMAGMHFNKGKRKNTTCVCSKYDCCRANIWTPIWEFMQTSSIDGMLKGQKLSDHEQAGWDPYCFVGGRQIDLYYPLRDWTDDKVRDYIKEQGELMYERFNLSHSSLDCWSCTAYWDQLSERALYMKERHKDRWAMVDTVIKDIKETIKDSMNCLGGIDG